MRWDQLLVRWAAVVCLSCLLFPRVSGAAFTTINPPFNGEDSHQQILSRIYQSEGGNMTPFGTRGVDFANSSLIAFRVDDRLTRAGGGGDSGGPTEMGGPTGGDDDTDQLWRAVFTGAVAQARFASFQQTFGYFEGTSGGPFIQLFALTGDRYNVDGEANISVLAGKTLRWGRGGQNRIVSSRIADNLDNEDHMVTYQILPRSGPEGGQAAFRWMIFFEDLFRNEPFADFDFNDLVVEITAIPEPATISAASLLCLLALRRSRRA